MSSHESHKFNVAAGRIKQLSQSFLITWFGERCADFHEDCACCKRWASLDYLTSNPFEDRNEVRIPSFAADGPVPAVDPVDEPQPDSDSPTAV